MIMITQLPAHIILSICHFISNKTDLLAFISTCKLVRELVLNNSNLVLKSRHTVSFVCGKASASLSSSDNDVRIFFEFINHIASLTFTWSECKTQNVLALSNDILQLHSLNVKILHLKPRNETVCTKSCQKQSNTQRWSNVETTSKHSFDVDSTLNQRCEPVGIQPDREVQLNCNNQLIVEQLSLLLKKLPKLEQLDLGFDPYLQTIFHGCDTSCYKFIGAKLHTVNIAWIKSNEDDQRSICYRFCDIKQLQMLTKLCLNVDKQFLELIEMLADSSTHTKLKEITAVVYQWSDTYLLGSIADSVWEKLQHRTSIQLKLVIIERHEYGQINIIPKNFPLHSLVIISPHLYHESRVLFVMWDFLKSACALEFHCLEMNRKHTPFIFSNFGRPHLDLNKKLEKLVFSGMFMEDTTLLEIATLLGRQLKELAVHRRNVLRESSVTGFLLPLTTTQAYGIERTMTSALGREWHFAKDPQINRTICGSYQSKTKCIFQEVT